MNAVLTALLAGLERTGLGLDAQDARDALWLALRIAERGRSGAPAAAGRPAAAAAVGRPPGPGAAAQGGAAAPAEAGPLAPAGAGRGEDRGAVRALRLPEVAPLPGGRELTRAIRPLRRRLPSPVRRELDLDATVRQAAEEDLWLPVVRPAPERWLDLELVVEHSLSMALWRDTVQGLRRWLAGAGAFRRLRLWWLSGEGEAVSLHVRPGDAAAGRRARSLHRLTGGGRRLILVFSDAVSPAWDDGRMGAVLRDWARNTPVALLCALPERLWFRSALGQGLPVRLWSYRPATANGRLHWAGELPWPAFGGIGRDLLVLPVATLRPPSLDRLARLLAANGPAWAPGLVLDLAEQGAAPADDAPPPTAPDERVAHFWSVASAGAGRLMGLLAAAPYPSLKLLRLLRREMAPGAGQVHEAEVLLSGLLEARPAGGGLDPDDLALSFQPGVRPLLLDAATVPEVQGVLERCAAAARRQGGVAPDFAALLAAPAAAGLEPAAAEFLRRSAAALRKLGGAYERLLTDARAAGRPSGGQAGVPPEAVPALWPRLLVVVVSESDRSVPLFNLNCELVNAGTVRRTVHALEAELTAPDGRRLRCRWNVFYEFYPTSGRMRKTGDARSVTLEAGQSLSLGIQFRGARMAAAWNWAAGPYRCRLLGWLGDPAETVLRTEFGFELGAMEAERLGFWSGASKSDWDRLGDPDRAVGIAARIDAASVATGPAPSLQDAAARAGAWRLGAEAAMARGDYRQAVDAYRRALALFGQAGDRPARIDAGHELARAALELGQLDMAAEAAYEALEICHRDNVRAPAVGLYRLLGLIHEQGGRVDDAHDAFRSSVEVAGQIGDLRGEALGLESLARATARMGDQRYALQLYGRVLELLQKLDVEPEAQARIRRLLDESGKLS